MEGGGCCEVEPGRGVRTSGEGGGDRVVKVHAQVDLAREAKKKSLSARWAVIAGDGVSVKPVLESLCNQESYNPEANATGVAACEMLARYSFPAGWCAPGYCRFPSQHMFNPITESYLSGSSF